VSAFRRTPVRLDVDINGRVRAVSVESADSPGPQGGSFRVSVDGELLDVHASVTDLGVLLQFADGRAVDAAVTERPGGEWLVQLPRATLTARLDGRRSRAGVGAGALLADAQRVTAPMPGRVLRVLVKPGDEVAERQGLLVVEAMKMENEIGSPRAGRVKEVAVSEGLSIEAGRLLVIVE
jgi:biotin carboxyl carrier protein